MEAYEQIIRDTRRLLRQANKPVSDVIQQQLARLETSERVLRHIRLQNETYTHIETYQRVCIIFIDNIVLSTRAALISKVTHNMSQGKSDLSKILPQFGEVKGYLEELESKNKEIDPVMNQIEEMLKRQNYKLTEEEELKVEMLLTDVETKWRQAKTHFETANKTLESLNSKVVSYKAENGGIGKKVLQSVVAGAIVGAVGVTFFPVVAPAVAVYGGGFLAGVSRFFRETVLSYSEYRMLGDESDKLQSRLNELKSWAQN